MGVRHGIRFIGGASYGKVDLDVDLPLDVWEHALMAHTNVEAVRRKLKPKGSSCKSKGNHWSPWELEVSLSGFRRPFTTAVTKFNCPTGFGVHVYRRGLPNVPGFFSAVRATMTAALQQALDAQRHSASSASGPPCLVPPTARQPLSSPAPRDAPQPLSSTPPQTPPPQPRSLQLPSPAPGGVPLDMQAAAGKPNVIMEPASADPIRHGTLEVEVTGPTGPAADMPEVMAELMEPASGGRSLALKLYPAWPVTAGGPVARPEPDEQDDVYGEPADAGPDGVLPVAEPELARPDEAELEGDLLVQTDLGCGLETPAGCLASDARLGAPAFQAADADGDPNFEVFRPATGGPSAHQANPVGHVMSVNLNIPEWATGATGLPAWVLPSLPPDGAAQPLPDRDAKRKHHRCVPDRDGGELDVKTVQDAGAGSELDPTTDLKSFLHHAGSRGLTLMKRLAEETQRKGEGGLKLWEALPPDTRRPASGGPEDAVHYVCHELFNLSRGEVVELESHWWWYQGDVPAKKSHPWLFDPQFALVGKCEPPPDLPAWEFGADAPALGLRGFDARQPLAERSRPDFGRQISRVLAPDPASQHAHWLRHATVTTWPDLVEAMKDKATAAALWSFFMSRRVIAAKKFRTPAKLAREAATARRQAARELLPEVCRQHGIQEPKTRAARAALARAIGQWIAALTLAAVQPTWLPSERPASGGRSLTWQICRLGLLRVAMTALPAEVNEAIREAWPATGDQSHNSVCGQVLYNCPVLVEAGCRMYPCCVVVFFALASMLPMLFVYSLG